MEVHTSPDLPSEGGMRFVNFGHCFIPGTIIVRFPSYGYHFTLSENNLIQFVRQFGAKLCQLSLFFSPCIFCTFPILQYHMMISYRMRVQLKARIIATKWRIWQETRLQVLFRSTALNYFIGTLLLESTWSWFGRVTLKAKVTPIQQLVKTSNSFYRFHYIFHWSPALNVKAQQ